MCMQWSVAGQEGTLGKWRRTWQTRNGNSFNINTLTVSLLCVLHFCNDCVAGFFASVLIVLFFP